MRYHSLDLFRGIACLMVVVLHSSFYASDSPNSDPASWLIWLARRLWLGVPIFFVISGYCIAATAESSERKGHRTLDYFRRRVRRIFPPYWICLAITAIVVGTCELFILPGLFSDSKDAIARPWDISGWHWLGNVALAEGWLNGSRNQGWFLANAWTLGYEEQFYAVTGLLLLVAPQRFFFGAAAVTGIVLLLVPFRQELQGFFFDGFWLQFAAGIGVYYCVTRPSLWPKLLFALVLVCGLAWELFAKMPEKNSFLIAYLFALALLLLYRFDKQIYGSHLAVPFNVCGTMCYSLYLVHWPICKAISHGVWLLGLRSDAATVALTIPLCVVSSFGAGWLFHVYVERRFLNAPQKTSVSSTPAEMVELPIPQVAGNSS